MRDRMRLLTTMCMVGLAVSGCSGSKLSETIRTDYSGPPVTAIAISPGGGPFADAVGVELFNDGLTVLDADQTQGIIGRAGLTDLQVASPTSYEALSEAGADALLVVKAVMASDGSPESASVRLTSTHTSDVIAGLTWQNGWGGMRGSIADRTMRKNLAEAAGQIADGIMKRIRE